MLLLADYDRDRHHILKPPERQTIKSYIIVQNPIG